ncbi:MAG: type I glyceraldehyde-3-phosphate dehydrogenase [Abitibacteriaceae bacterium]|nr:type I glyceraldehyde-3-phosphate dehydrogenase [Abditibacteriaceae bacterium]
MAVKVGINGFGRIGRITFRAITEKYGDSIEVVAINDLSDPKTNAHLLKHDSNYGAFSGSVEVQEDGFVVNGKTVKVFKERDPANLKWSDVGADIVVESTGFFTDATKARAHIDSGGAKKVIISAPAKNEDLTIALGVNADKYDPQQHNVVSNASCTTNCLAPVAKVIIDTFGIESGFMTTVHSYTNDQRIADQVHEDLRRARAAAVSIIPASTGAAKAISLVIPELKGKMHGIAMRVPTPTVSIVDLVVNTEKSVTAEAANEAFTAAANGAMKGILGIEEEQLVSVDFKGDPRSSIVDAPSTMVLGDKMLKVLSWYDNEWGYSCRVADLINFMSSKGL